MMTLVLAYQYKHMPNKQFLCANIVIGCILNLGPKKKMKARVRKLTLLFDLQDTTFVFL